MIAQDDRCVPFTTTLPADVAADLAAAATETGMTKSAILVDAVRFWNHTRKLELLAASYARAQRPDTATAL